MEIVALHCSALAPKKNIEREKKIVAAEERRRKKKRVLVG